ncbi:sigma-70 family RNA polymerase sigma factor [soil metagenome]
MRPSVHDEFLNETLPCLDLVYNLTRRMVRDPYVVEDLVQETYTRAFEAWTSQRKPRNVQAWIATICLNLNRSWLRKASTRREIPSEEIADRRANSTVESEALQRLGSDAIHAALMELPEEQRAAITLMDLNGFTAKETAQITGAPRNTVLSRVHRGRKRLASLLEKEVWVDEGT